MNHGLRFCILVLLGMMFAGAGTSQEAALPAPQLQAEDRPTRPERRRVFYQDQFLGGYETYGRADAPWREEGIALLNNFAAYLAYDDHGFHPHPEGLPTMADLAEQRSVLIEAGADEPYLDYFCMLVDPERNSRFRAVHFEIQEAMRAYAAEAGNPKRFERVLLCVEHWVMRSALARNDNRGRREWARKDRLTASDNYSLLFAEDVLLSPNDQENYAELFRYYVNDIDNTQLPKLMRATEQVAPGKQWLAHVLRGMVFIQSAWEARSSKWGKDVADDQWRKFGVYLQFAEDEFTAAIALHPERSTAATELITVSMGQSNDNELEWFGHAMRADPQDSKAYINLQWASRKRWGGDATAMLAIARQAFESGRYDIDLPDRFERGIANIISDYGYDRIAPGAMDGEGDEIWQMLQTYFEKRAAQPTAERPADWCWSRGFRLARRADRPDAQWDYFTKLDQNPDRLYKPYYIGIDKRWDIGAFAIEREPEALFAFERAKQMLNSGLYEQAERALTEAEAKAENPWAKTHVRDLKRLTAWDRAFWNGEQVDVLEHGLEGWRPSRGFAQDTERGIEVTANDAKEARLFCGLNLGEHYEAELTMTVPEGFHGPFWGGAGFVLSPTVTRKPFNTTMLFAARDDEVGVYLQDPDVEPKNDLNLGQPVNTQTMTMTLQRWGKRLRCSVNGIAMIDSYELATEQYGETELGLGLWYGTQLGKFHFESLRVRLLESSPFENAPVRPQAF
ncbi:DUF4034 domain-containing protein [Algisphaera agarilytica]|uniref:3-keto-disaccharide hydrolase domain-containing protein n=1 Tax=Algisphaera agarilytica TaxID=1385975 RepID=A0A7X0H6Z8_9BACT|nr:DUF4034 domain-containing protein [Algisphaera agarilytica]MBB6430222.1 hypothetical protein [Algisphaera agarilytica]